MLIGACSSGSHRLPDPLSSSTIGGRREGPTGVVVRHPEVGRDGRGVQGRRDSQRPPERPPPDGELEAYVQNYADTISANAPLTVDSVKYIVGQVVVEESKRDLQKCADLVSACFASRDYTEGRTAFMEKRKPKFTGS